MEREGERSSESSILNQSLDFAKYAPKKKPYQTANIGYLMRLFVVCSRYNVMINRNDPTGTSGSGILNGKKKSCMIPRKLV